MNQSSSDSSKSDSSSKGGGDLARVRRLREELSEAQKEARQLREQLRRVLLEKRKLQEKNDLLEEENETLEELKNEAWEIVYDNGLTDSFEFPVSHEAIALYQAVRTPANLEDVRRTAEELECDEEEMLGLVAELIEEEMWRGTSPKEIEKGTVFRSTGHEPFL